MRKNIYTQSIGSWRKYAKQLQPLIKEFKQYLPALRKKGALVYTNQINWDCDEHFDYNKTLTEKVDTDGDSDASRRDDMTRQRDGRKVYNAKEEEVELEDEEEVEPVEGGYKISVDGGYEGFLKSDSGSNGRRRRRNSKADDDWVSVEAARGRKKRRTGRRNRYRGEKPASTMDAKRTVDVHEGRREASMEREIEGHMSTDEDKNKDKDEEEAGEEEILGETTRRSRNKRKIGNRSSGGRRRRRRRTNGDGLESNSVHDEESLRSSVKRRRAKVGRRDRRNRQYDDEHVNDDDNRHEDEIIENDHDSEGHQKQEIRRKNKQPSSRKRAIQQSEEVDVELDGSIDSQLSVLYSRYSHESREPMTGNVLTSKNQKKSTKDEDKKELRLLATKGMTAEGLRTSLDRMVINWVQKSVDPRIDYLIAIALLFVHIEERATCISILREVCSLYREIGFLAPSTGGSIASSTSTKYSEVGGSVVAFEHRWAADVKVSSGDTCPLSRALAGKYRETSKERSIKKESKRDDEGRETVNFRPTSV